MNEFIKRVKGASWVAFAGFVVTIITLTLQDIEAFNLTEQQQAVAIIFGTAIVSQITKWLNKREYELG